MNTCSTCSACTMRGRGLLEPVDNLLKLLDIEYEGGRKTNTNQACEIQEEERVADDRS